LVYFTCGRRPDVSKAGSGDIVTEFLKTRRKGGEPDGRRAASMEAEDVLRKVRTLFSRISDLAYICDSKGNIRYINESFETLAGHAVAEFLGRPFHLLFDDENNRIAELNFKKTLAGEPTTCELYFKDTGKLCEFKSVPLHDGPGPATGVIGIGREVPMGRVECERLTKDRGVLADLVQERTKELIAATEERSREAGRREEAEKAAEGCEKMLIALLAATPEAVIIAEAADGVILRANSRAARITGVPVEEMAGMRLGEFGIRSPFHSASTGRPKKTYIRNTRSSKASVVEISSTEAEAGGRKVLNLVIRELSAKPLDTSGANLFRALEQSQSAVVIADINGAIEFVNPVFERLTGASARDAAGRNIRSYFTARSEKEPDELWVTVLEGSPWRGRGMLRAAESSPGAICDSLVTPVRVDGKGVTHLLCMHDPVTMRKQTPRL